MAMQKWRETRVVGERIGLDEYERRPELGERQSITLIRCLANF